MYEIEDRPADQDAAELELWKILEDAAELAEFDGTILHGEPVLAVAWTFPSDQVARMDDIRERLGAH